jgi:hypothetical protein
MGDLIQQGVTQQDYSLTGAALEADGKISFFTLDGDGSSGAPEPAQTG